MPFYYRLGQLPKKRHTQFRRPDGVLASITAVAQAFADAGRPLTP